MKRRSRGSGAIYTKGKGRSIWWIAYTGPDGTRWRESSHSTRKSDAVTLLTRRTGAREHGLPVVKNAELLTFDEGAQALIDHYTVNGKRSLNVLTRRIKKHLKPFFGGKRLAGITRDHVLAYTAHRQQQGIVRKGVRVANVSNAEINRELATLKQVCTMAIQGGRLGSRPHIPMLKENNVRTGFFEADQFSSVLSHLPDELQGIVEFTYFTGWRIASEVMPLQWRHVDFEAGEVRLDAGTTKNTDGRAFPMTVDLRRILLAQWAAHEKWRDAGHIVPQVFFRTVGKRGGRGPKEPRPIVSLAKAWRAACKAAGCPGRILHDLRRTAVRNLDRAGITRSVAMQMVGHRTDSIYRRYRIVDAQDLRDAAAKLDAGHGVPAKEA